MDDKKAPEKPTFLKRKAALKVTFCVKKTRDASYKKISAILRKAEHERTEEELQVLCSGENIVQEIKDKLLKRQRLKDRLQEFEDPPEVLKEKCVVLAKAISQSKHLIVYTGAGISTAARIPDYRGTNGVWTLLEQGKDIGLHDLSRAKPTFTHMALFRLFQEKILKHIVSQNCDGLHLRSGIPRSALSEIHGNMFLEVCHDCEPIRFYLRLFDVTQHTARYSHETLRLCYYCGSPLCDTIVHFGERGVLQWPLNWKAASDNANQADVILCLGSSLKVLKKYPWLWGMDKPMKKRPQLFIVNLQWTPKDEQASLKINGKCDEVLQQLMDLLNLPVPKYRRLLDPIYNHATLIHSVESHTTSKPSLKFPRNSFLEQIPSNNQKFLENHLDSKNVDSCASSDSETPLSNLKAKLKEENPALEIKNLSQDLSLTIKSEDSFVSTVLGAGSSDVNNSLIMNGIIVENTSFNICDIVKKEEAIEVNVWESVENASFPQDKNVLIVEENEGELEKRKFGTLEESIVMFDYELNDYESLNSVDLALGAVETVGISIPVDEFDDMYTKIRENLMKESKEGNNDFKNTSIKSESVIISDNICDNLQIEDTHSMKKTDSINDLSSSDEDYTPSSHSAVNAYFQKSVFTHSNEGMNLSQYSCNFCLVNYDSSNCLFYSKFINDSPNFKERRCLCCENSEDSVAKEQSCNPTKVSQQNSINPGWFGKGYRKKIKKKRRE